MLCRGAVRRGAAGRRVSGLHGAGAPDFLAAPAPAVVALVRRQTADLLGLQAAPWMVSGALPSCAARIAGTSSSTEATPMTRPSTPTPTARLDGDRIAESSAARSESVSASKVWP